MSKNNFQKPSVQNPNPNPLNIFGHDSAPMSVKTIPTPILTLKHTYETLHMELKGKSLSYMYHFAVAYSNVT